MQYERTISSLILEARKFELPVFQWDQWTQFGSSSSDDSIPKFHVSLGLNDLTEVVLQIGKPLIEREVCFKVTSSLSSAEMLNAGKWGYQQAGKTITIYPDEGNAVFQLSSLLRELCAGIYGAPPVTDIRLTGSGCVSARLESWPRDLPSENDVRELIQQYPGLFEGLSPSPPLPSRYVALQCVAIRGAGVRIKALDLENSRLQERSAYVMIKQARRNAERDYFGIDAVSRLQHQIAIHTRLRDCPGFPTVRDVVELNDGSLLAAFDYIEGSSLWSCRDSFNSPETVVDFCNKFMPEVMHIAHEHQVLLGDISPDNIILTTDGHIRFIDLDDALMDGEPGFPRSTPLFSPPDFVKLNICRDYLQFSRLALMLSVGQEGLRSLDTGTSKWSRLIPLPVASWLEAALLSIGLTPEDCYGTEWR